MTYNDFVETFKNQVNALSHEKGLELVLTCVSHRNFDFKDFAYTFSLVHSKGWGASLYTSI